MSVGFRLSLLSQTIVSKKLMRSALSHRSCAKFVDEERGTPIIDLFGNVNLGYWHCVFPYIYGILLPFVFPDKDVIMERWHRAFLKNAVEFKELFGIKKEIFLEMLPILTAAYHERHRKGGRRPKLSVGRPVVPYPSIPAGVSDDGTLGLRFRHCQEYGQRHDYVSRKHIDTEWFVLFVGQKSVACTRKRKSYTGSGHYRKSD